MSTGGQVAAGDLHRRLPGESLRQQAALQGQGGGPLAGVAPGVVKRKGGSGGEFLGEQHVVLLEGVWTLAAEERRDAEGDPAGAYRNRQDGVNPELADSRRPSRVVADGRHEREIVHAGQYRFAGGQALGCREGLRMDVYFPGLDHGLGDTLEDGLMGNAAQGDGAGERSRARLVPAQHGVEQVNDGQVGEPRYHHVGQFLGCPGDIQRGADLSAGLIQQGQPLACPVLLGDVEHADPHCLRPAGLILQRGDRNRPGAFPGLTRYPAAGPPAHRLPCVEHLAHVVLHGVVLGTVQDVGEAPSAQLVFDEPEHLAHAVVDAQAQQVPVMDRQSERRLGERPVHEGRIIHRSPPSLPCLGRLRRSQPVLSSAEPLHRHRR